MGVEAGAECDRLNSIAINEVPLERAGLKTESRYGEREPFERKPLQRERAVRENAMNEDPALLNGALNGSLQGTNVNVPHVGLLAGCRELFQRCFQYPHDQVREREGAARRQP